MSGFAIFHIFEKKEKETEIERIIKWHSIKKKKFIVFAIKYDIFAIK